MNILFDHQVFSLETMGGMTKYYTELMEGLLKEGHQVSLPIWASNNSYLKEFQEKQKDNKKLFLPRPVNPFGSLQFKGKQNLLYRYNKYKFLLNPDKHLQGVDLVHITLFDPYMIHILKRKNIPFVFNVYDLNHKTEQLKKGLFDLRMCDYADKGIQQLGENSNAIICVSNQTKIQLLKYYPTLKSDKIQIIYHSINLTQVTKLQSHKAAAQNGRLGSTEAWKHGNYILFIGKRKAGYKNFKSFVKAIAPLLSDKLLLVCLGHMEFDEEESKLLYDLGIQDFVHFTGGDEQRKFELLKNAQVFIFPSLAEGFGIPILEAWAAGCPVLCSNISVFMEIGSGAALYFDPKNEENMRELIHGVVNNKDLQDNLRKAGLERVKLFDKQVEINKTVTLYEQIIQN